MVFVMVAAFFGCGENKIDTSEVSVVINAMEYTVYQNVFYNGMADNYVGLENTKTGIFTVLYDEFHQTTRYYVWGYKDQTKCCDWQWEMNFKDGEPLPKSGSLVVCRGKFEKNQDALDGYWYTDATVVEVKQEYTGVTADVNMACMSATLEWVELRNLAAYPEAFEGKSLIFYGRSQAPGSVLHPYYDGAWEYPITTSETMPATGTSILVSGTVKSGEIVDCHIEETTRY